MEGPLARLRPVLLAAVLAQLACAAGCGTAVGRRRGRPGTAIESVRGKALIGAEYKNNRRGDGARTEQTLLREEVEAAIAGRIYDSRFLRYAGALRLGFNQAKISGNGGFQNLFVPSYFAELRFLEQHPTPVTLFGRREEDRYLVDSRTTTALVESITDEVGAKASYRTTTFTASISANRALLRTRGLDADRDSDQSWVQLAFDHRPSAAVRTWGNLVAESYRETFSGQDYDTRSFWLYNLVKVGDVGTRRGLTFNGQFNGQVRDGTTSFTNLNASEDVRWWLRENLLSRTILDYRFYESGAETERWGLDQEFTHWLFDSLETRLRAYTSRERIDDGRIGILGGELALDYRKYTLFGQVRAGYKASLERQDNDFEGIRQVVDEGHVLSTTTVSVLANPDVDPASVVVTNATGSITYVEGVDYELIPRGRQLEIVRIPGGLIADGQQVLVDYLFTTAAKAVFETTNQFFFVEVFLHKTLRLNARYGRLRQDLLEGDAGKALEDRDELGLLAELFWRDLRLRAEYVDVDSTTAPFQQTRLEANWARLVAERTRLQLGATHIDTAFEEGGNSRSSVFTAAINARPGRRLNLRLETEYRIERGRGLDRDVARLIFDLVYTYGKLRLRWRARHDSFFLEGPDNRDTYTAITLERQW